jgi:holo-[acyl-carrier protein] synthase
MIQGIGCDLVDLKRIDIHNETFIKHILSDKEYACFESLSSDKRKKEYLGGRFAGKEAYLKAIGTGIGGKAFKEIEILNDEAGKPTINDPQALITLSHEKEMAMAFVVISD